MRASCDVLTLDDAADSLRAPPNTQSQLIRGHITKCFLHDRCMYFDYGFSDDEPNKVFLYETYEVGRTLPSMLFPICHVPAPATFRT